MNAIETFLRRVAKMTTTRSKELRITFEDANALAVEIGILLNEELEDRTDQATQPVIISGGALKPAQSE